MEASGKAETSLLRLALGYTYQETETRTSRSGKTEIVRTRTAHPSYRAIALWLANHGRG